MVAVNGLLAAEAGQTHLAALEPLARPCTGQDPRSGGRRPADALAELAAGPGKAGRLPQTGGIRPQLLVRVDLDSLLGRPGTVGASSGPAARWIRGCRRLACDATVPRVLVTRHPTASTVSTSRGGATGNERSATATHGMDEGLAARLRAAMAPLAPVLGGAPNQPLDVGRPGRPTRPTHRPGQPRRRLDGPRLRPASGLVRRPPPVALAGRRPHRPGQPGPDVPGSSSGRP
jgi:Domain of unknown function (DUF222)